MLSKISFGERWEGKDSPACAVVMTTADAEDLARVILKVIEKNKLEVAARAN